MALAEICAGVTGFCVCVGSLASGTLFDKALCFGSLKPVEVGWSIPGTAAGRGQVGTFFQSPEVLGSSELQSWGRAGRQMARAQPMAGSGQCMWERGCLHPRCWAPRYLVSTHHGGVHSCLTVVSPTLSTCLWALSFQRMGQGPMQREREHFSSSSAPSTLQEDHAIEESQHRGEVRVTGRQTILNKEGEPRDEAGVGTGCFRSCCGQGYKFLAAKGRICLQCGRPRFHL